MSKEIRLGDVHIASWQRGDDLYPEWMKEDGEYDKEIEANKPNDVILPANKTYILVIDYPLSIPAKIPLKTGKKGMTRSQFVDKVCKAYRAIYKAEDSTSSRKVRLGKDGGSAPMFNREQSDGKWGIWGHDIGDLILCAVHVRGKNLEIGSNLQVRTWRLELTRERNNIRNTKVRIGRKLRSFCLR